MGCGRAGDGQVLRARRSSPGDGGAGGPAAPGTQPLTAGRRLRAVERDGPQTITRHGDEVAVVLSIDAYRRLSGATNSFMQHLTSSPNGGRRRLVRVPNPFIGAN